MMPNYDMFVYPCIFEETSCVSALEALASGVHVITNNFGACMKHVQSGLSM